MSSSSKSAERVYMERKVRYKAKFERLLSTYKNCLICKVDFVGSTQLQEVRLRTRGRCEIIFGKNTLMRRVIREVGETNKKVLELLPLISGNMGLVFCHDNLSGLRKEIMSNRVPAAAKVNAFAPIDVMIPAGPTPLDPGQTSFFQALNISTKITKGCIEIMNDVKLCNAGQRVTASAVALLNKLAIKPFFFGIEIDDIFEDGEVYASKVLELTPAVITATFLRHVSTVAALSISARWPTKAAVPHMIMDGFKQVLAFALEGCIDFEQAKLYKEMLADPSKFAAAAAPVAAAAAAPAKKAAAAAKVEEPEEEEDAGFSLFD